MNSAMISNQGRMRRDGHKIFMPTYNSKKASSIPALPHHSLSLAATICSRSRGGRLGDITNVCRVAHTLRADSDGGVCPCSNSLRRWSAVPPACMVKWTETDQRPVVSLYKLQACDSIADCIERVHGWPGRGTWGRKTDALRMSVCLSA